MSETEEKVLPGEAETEGTKPETEEKKKKKKDKEKKSLGQEILSWVLTILCAVAAALVIRSVIFEPVRVDGGSMDDTLADKEIMLVSKYDYSSTWLSMPWNSDNDAQNAARITFGNPKLLDVVICRYPARGAMNFVKRVTGMPGDTVELRDGYLYLNGAQCEEEKDLINPEYRIRQFSNGQSFGPYYVPKKGDKLTVSGSSSVLQIQINGDLWDRKESCLIAKDGDGKQLKICNRKTDGSSHSGMHEEETEVISYDGKEWTEGSWDEIIPTLTAKEFTIDDNYYFLMGDHRNNSNDSRSVGAVERSMIIGHVRRVVFPFNQWRGIR